MKTDHPANVAEQGQLVQHKRNLISTRKLKFNQTLLKCLNTKLHGLSHAKTSKDNCACDTYEHGLLPGVYATLACKNNLLITWWPFTQKVAHL